MEKENLVEIGTTDLWISDHLNENQEIVFEIGGECRVVIDCRDIGMLIAHVDALLNPPLYPPRRRRTDG